MAKKEQIIDKTIDASNLDVPIEGMFMKEKRYALTPLEHKVLSGSDSILREWSKRFLLISIGLTLTIVSKIIIFLYAFSNINDDKKKDLKLEIQDWELIYLCIGFGLALILFLLSKTRLEKSERKTIMKKIKKYFNGD